MRAAHTQPRYFPTDVTLRSGTLYLAVRPHDPTHVSQSQSIYFIYPRLQQKILTPKPDDRPLRAVHYPDLTQLQPERGFDLPLGILRDDPASIYPTYPACALSSEAISLKFKFTKPRARRDSPPHRKTKYQGPT